MKKQTPLIQKASAHVFEVMREKLPVTYIFHNYSHTVSVADSVAEIAEGVDLNREETEIVILAAWFHDLGFIEKYYGHEAVSKELAQQFLSENLFPEEKIQMVLGCIEATKYPQHPKNLMEQALADADLAGISDKKYIERSNYLRIEREFVDQKKLTDVEWYSAEVNFIANHKYHTPYAHLKFEKKKIDHVLEMKELLKESEEKSVKLSKKSDLKSDDKLEKEKRPDRGIETMFRVTMSNHMNLSKMADDKANFLLSINGIILSFAIANLLSKFDVSTNSFLIAPTAILMVVCLLSIIFAVLSTRPKISKGNSSKVEIEKREANLLFFGNFHGMKFEDFKWGIGLMMSDREYLYGSMTKDLYFLGKVLGKKYRLIRTAYTIFMWGMIISVAAYAISFIYMFYFSGYQISNPIPISY